MKYVLFFILFLASMLTQYTAARTIEVEVHGLTCAFCVDTLERQFGQMNSVLNLQVSLKNKKIRLQTEKDEPSLEIIKQTILDAGFTPLKMTILTDKKAEDESPAETTEMD